MSWDRSGRVSNPPDRSYLLLSRALASICLICVTIIAWCSNASIKNTIIPGVAVADGRSPITLKVEIFDSKGLRVPNGTQVIFSSTAGRFKDYVLTTLNGVAIATLIAAETPGMSKITVSVPGYDATTVIDYEFVKDKSQLAAATDYIEVISPAELMYSPELRVLVASGNKRGAKIRYRDLEIEADDLQIKVLSYEVRAKKARLRFKGGPFREYEKLYFVLNRREGIGITTYQTEVQKIVSSPPLFAVENETVERLGPVVIKSADIEPYKGTVNESSFRMEEISGVTTLISGEKAIVYPARRIDFHKAGVYANGTKVMGVPLFQVSTHTATPLLTDQMLSISNNELAINYPHYLTLRPGETSLLRFQLGDRYGRGTGASGGSFLNYELNWNKEEQINGGLIVSGLARKDWGVALHQYMKLDDRTVASGQLDFPSNSSLLGAMNVSRGFNGFQASYIGNFGQSVRGTRFKNQQHHLTLEKDPIKMGRLPANLILGVGASSSSFSSSTLSQSQESVGFRQRLQMNPMTVGKASLNASLNLGQRTGRNVRSSLTTGLTTSLGFSPFANSSALIGYDYLDDGFNSTLIGRHRMNSQFYWDHGAVSTSLLAEKSLDIDRVATFADVSYRLSTLWRLGSTFSMEQFQGSQLLDYGLLLGYRVGAREVGLSWSRRTRRVGIEILGASF